MASFYAELQVAGHTYPLRQCSYAFTQATDARGRVAARVRHGLVQLVLDVPDDDLLLDWANTAHKSLPGRVVFYETKGRAARETLSWEAGQCVSYDEAFESGSSTEGAYVCRLTITAPKLTMQPGGPGQYAPPTPGEHGAPLGAAVLGAAGTVAPLVAAAAGSVVRLPRITGDPPFTVKGAKKGKPGLDRAEFVRQLTGQEAGLNRLTVAQFLANRDQYMARALLTGDGRDPQGDMAQKVAREEALADKLEELQIADDNLSEAEALEQAQQWLDTQAALHDPDQVAGGHAHIIADMGDARVNSSIGGQWPKRIAGVDKQIRQYAAGLTQQERENTFLNIKLPLR